MEGFVGVTVHPHRTAAWLKSRVYEVHHQGLAAARLPGHEHHHGVLLSRRGPAQLGPGQLSLTSAALCHFSLPSHRHKTKAKSKVNQEANPRVKVR